MVLYTWPLLSQPITVGHVSGPCKRSETIVEHEGDSYTCRNWNIRNENKSLTKSLKKWKYESNSSPSRGRHYTIECWSIESCCRLISNIRHTIILARKFNNNNNKYLWKFHDIAIWNFGCILTFNLMIE